MRWKIHGLEMKEDNYVFVNTGRVLLVGAVALIWWLHDLDLRYLDGQLGNCWCVGR